jgi:hypothetical protein
MNRMKTGALVAILTLLSVGTGSAGDCSGKKYWSDCDFHGPVTGTHDNDLISDNTAGGISTVVRKREKSCWKTKVCSTCAWNETSQRCEDDEEESCPENCTDGSKYGEQDWDGTVTAMSGTITINIGAGVTLNLSSSTDANVAVGAIKAKIPLGGSATVTIATSGTITGDGSGNASLPFSSVETKWDDEPDGWADPGDCNT